MGLSYFTCIFLVARPFCRYQYFDLVALTLTLTYFWKNLNWLPRGHCPVRTDPDLVGFVCVLSEGENLDLFQEILFQKGQGHNVLITRNDFRCI